MRIRPQLVVAIGVAFTALSAIFVRLSDAPALAIASYRMVFTSLLLAPLYLRERARTRTVSGHDEALEAPVGADPSGRQDRRRAAPPKRLAIALSVLSGAFLALHFALWISSLAYTSVASSTVLVTTHPLIVGLVGYLLLGEHLSPKGVALMLVALGGGVVLVWGGLGEGESVLFGNVLAFLGAVTVGGYMLLGRVVRRTLSVNRYTMIVYSTSAIVLVVTALVARVPLYPYPPRELAIFLGLAVFCTLLGHSLFNWALKYLKPTVISTSILGEPVIASVLAVLLFGEMPTLSTLLGGLIILTAIYLFVRVEATEARIAAQQADPM
ncbi:MAG: DMT family transporter [Spirochaetota bacterium]